VVQAIDEVRRRATGRVPPHNLEAEESLLGAMLLSRDAITAAVEARVDATDFYKPAHTHVFEAVMSLYGQGEPVDPVTVAEELRRAELLDALGGKATLLRIQAGTPASANAGHYATIVNELALLRRLIAVAGEIAEMGYDSPDDVTETLDRAESLVFEVAERRVSESLTGISDALQSTLDQLESMYGRESDVTGVPTGYHDLDELLLGLQPSNLVIVAARPGAGKCVAWDTPIVDPATGAVRTAAEVYREGRQGNEVRVLSLDDDRRIRCVAPSAFVDDGVKPVYRVQTRSGRVIRTTLSHPFLTPAGWRPLAEITTGTRIAVPRRIPVFGREGVPEAELALIAFLLGDRTAANRSPETPGAPDPTLHDLKRHARALDVSVEPNGRGGYRLIPRRGSSRPVASHRGVGLLRRYGLLQERASTRQVPEIVFRLPRARMAFFLNHLLATDGSIWIERQSATVSYLSSSERLARDVQHLLLRFGVVSRVRQRAPRPGAARHPRWELQITEAESVRRFATEIGILGRNDDMRRALTVTNAGWAKQTLDDDSLDARVAMLARGWASRSGHPAGGARVDGTGSTAGVLERREPAMQPSADVCWDEVVAIEYDGDEQVYDLTVPGLHNFVAGDVFVHNTSFALGAAANVALVSRRPTIFFSMEMGKLELTKRLLAGEARVEARKLWTGNIPEGDWTRLSHAVGRLAEAPLFIDDNAHCTVMEMRAKARRIKARYGDLGMIVVDYVQLMSAGVRPAENRQVEVSELSRGLKILARELECPVMALSQLNRQLEYRQDKRPMLADLRESGALEQDADVVCFIYRDEIYNPESDQRGTAEIIVAKHRNGPTGSTRLAFLDHLTKFANMARD